MHIGNAISKYATEQGTDVDLPADNDFNALGLKAEDFDGTFGHEFSFTVHSLNPPKYTITVINKKLDPSVMTLDQDGMWAERAE